MFRAWILDHRQNIFVVNNSRYLLLPDRHVYPNLGSKVLSLCLKRLSGDWERARTSIPVVPHFSYYI